MANFGASQLNSSVRRLESLIMRNGEDPQLACPACGFVVLTEGYGSYDICSVCGWEDDSVQLQNPTSGGGANQDSLAEAQRAALRSWPVSLGEHLGYSRSPEWRPLTATEIEFFEAKRKIEHWHSKGVTAPDQAYWRRTRTDQ